MPNVHKTSLLAALTDRFGELRTVGESRSLFSVGEDAARLYVRYSKVHSGGRTFFGLREVDLRLLEGHNSFLCFLLDNGSEPLFVPYTDFEEVFRGAQPAADGQYKVQLFSQRQGSEIYVARMGRFNVEGYAGFPVLAASLEAARLRKPVNITHSQVQTLLAGIGHMKGYDVFVPVTDRSRLDWALTPGFSLATDIPRGFDRVADILSGVDVVWVAGGRNTIEALFEVEHSTPVYSALLRFNDVLLTDKSISRFTIVSNDTRRALFSRQLFRPTFVKSGLAELASFLQYPNVIHWHNRLMKGVVTP